MFEFSGNFGTVFVDQSYWQSSVAAKPRQGMWGFLAGGLVWFSIPFTFATTMGLGYVALGTYYGEPLLSDEDVSSGKIETGLTRYGVFYQWRSFVIGLAASSFPDLSELFPIVISKRLLLTSYKNRAVQHIPL